jgi:hypothetical protein
MKTHISLAFLLLFVVTLASCEVVVDCNELPFLEKLVVEGVLRADSTMPTIYFSRTLPLSTTYSREAAVLTDVQATIRDVGGAEYPLHYIGDGGYTNDSLVPRSGHTYQLVAIGAGKQISATTVVPVAVPIDSIDFSPSHDPYGGYSGRYRLRVRPLAPTAFQATYQSRYSARSPWQEEMIYPTNTDRSQDADSAGNLWVTNRSYYIYYGDSTRYEAVLYTYDPAFYDYAHSLRDGSNEDPFASAGTNPRWNIQGEAIGYFFGVARSTRPIVF